MFWKKREKNARIDHYAPDITVVPVNYVYPPLDKRMAEAEKEIKDFLSKTEPDKYNSAYYDRVAEKKEIVLLEELMEQRAQHENTIFLQAVKHQAELTRLKAEEAALWEELKMYEAEIESLK